MGLIADWFQVQIRLLREGGPAILLRKIGVLLSLVLTIVPAALFVVIMRLLKPWIIFRVGPLESGRIGHFAGGTEVYLCERDAGMHDPRTIDVLYHTRYICNHQLKKMWGRTLHVFPMVRWVDALNRLLPDKENHRISIGATDRDPHGHFEHTNPHLLFTPAEETDGREALARLGIPEGASFVCFHARDSAYLENSHKSRNWQCHNYRDANINNYLPAMEEMTRRDNYGIRLGAIVNEAIETSNPRIIDYAHGGFRTDFLDVYLGARCKFFIGSTAGIWAVPAIFRRPIVFVNYIPIEYMLSSNSTYINIFKKLWLIKERRFLSFREILDSGAGRYLHNDQYKQHGIEVIENTSEEITAAVLEMDERLNGTWQSSEEDEELQRRFWSLFKPNELNKIFVARVGAEFLRRNQELLDQQEISPTKPSS